MYNAVLAVANNILTKPYGITRYDGKDSSNICGFDGMTYFNAEYDSKISDFVTQFGDFTSYNKCNLPTLLHMRLGAQGTYGKLSNIIFLLEQYKSSVILVNIHTPFNVFIGFNITNFSYSITARDNIGYLDIDLKARQIYISKAQFSAYSNIEEAPQQLLGKIATFSAIVEIWDAAKALGYLPVLEGVSVVLSNRVRFR